MLIHHASHLINTPCITRFGMVHHMSAIHERLKRAREAAHFTSPSEAARALSVPVATYISNENGTRPFGRERAELYARRFRVNLDWLLSNRGPMTKARMVPVVGEVGAGAEVTAIDAHLQGGGFEEIEAPHDLSPDAKALRVRGTSMLPAYEDDDILIYDENLTDPSAMVNRRCVVKLADGRMLIKRLRRGQHGLWNLESFNDVLIENVAVEWVARIKYVIPR